MPDNLPIPLWVRKPLSSKEVMDEIHPKMLKFFGNVGQHGQEESCRLVWGFRVLERGAGGNQGIWVSSLHVLSGPFGLTAFMHMKTYFLIIMVKSNYYDYTSFFTKVMSQTTSFIHTDANFPAMDLRSCMLMWADGWTLQDTEGQKLQATPHHHALNHHGDVLRLKLMWKMCKSFSF